ncbi:MAG: Sec-independent protein translocase protein TatB [Alphaproteobacteria bacterium]
MFGIGWIELFIIGIVGLFVIKPEDLPKVVKTLAGIYRQIRGFIYTIKKEFEGALQEAETTITLEDLPDETLEAELLEGEEEDNTDAS